MKLLVIVLCLLSERFLVHASSHQRFYWFSTYGNAMEKRLSSVRLLSSPWLMLVVTLLPMLVVAFLVIHFFSAWLFGFVGLVLNVIIFYCCIGPGNPFYPVRASTTEDATREDVETYLAQMNGELFSILFWYIFLGPLAVLAYRLVSQSQNQPRISKEAFLLTNYLDWLPARMTSLLYLIVGNFQAGLRPFSKLFLSNTSNLAVFVVVCNVG